MGTMQKVPLVKWNEEAFRLKHLDMRQQAKSSKDLTVILTDTRLEMVYERLPRFLFDWLMDTVMCYVFLLFKCIWNPKQVSLSYML